MKHIEDELRRIEERLVNQPDPFEHAGLYVAQQALCWALSPEQYASPFAIVTGERGASENRGDPLPKSNA